MTLCPHCMSNPGPGSICSVCGSPLDYRAKAHQLPAGTILTDGAFRSFEIGAVKGQGGFGITYIAMDLRRKTRVALKEFFPIQCAQRSGIQVTAVPGLERVFAGGQNNFLHEARLLAGLPPMDSVVQILDYFEVNGTAYISMEYLDGTPLHRLIQSSGPIAADQLFPRMARLLLNLKDLHNAGIIHRDISPDNIMWMPDGSLKLLDFGSARHLEDGKSISIQLKHGFAPVEQYLTKGQGSFTDIYAICASMYYCLTGRVPPNAAERLEEDRLLAPSRCGVHLPVEREEALLWGLTVQPKARPQDVDSLMRRMFPGSIPVPPPLPKPEPEDPVLPVPPVSPIPPKPQPKLSRLPDKVRSLSAGAKIIAAAAAVVAVLLIVLVCVLTGGKKSLPTPPVQAEPVLQTPVEQPKPAEAPVSTPDPEPEPEPEPTPEPEPEPEEPKETVTEDGVMIRLTDDGEAHVVGYQGEDPRVLIPEEALGCPVTTIASGSFFESSISYIVFPPSLTHIQAGAFTNCADLSYILYGSVENVLHCEDSFIGCDKLMLIQVFQPDVWQGDVPETAFLLWSKMETPAGILDDFELLEDGCLYGWTEDENMVMLKAPSDVTDLVMADDCEDYLVYIMDGALDSAHDLQTISLTDRVYYSPATYECIMSLDNINVTYNSISFAWYATCAASYHANAFYGEDLVRPDMELSMIAHARAAEIAETFTEDRPDGSRWISILEDYGCSYAVQQGGRTNSEERILSNLQDQINDFAESAYDDNGNPYTEVGFGITMKDDVYYFIFFYTNND